MNCSMANICHGKRVVFHILVWSHTSVAAMQNLLHLLWHGSGCINNERRGGVIIISVLNEGKAQHLSQRQKLILTILFR